ncbi:hypothetical protein [Tabrizicola sp.]|uniref:hypothetical protein n=1 Tax=Tabrizicola sp. TaxID=2005166 RepID=UPI0035B128B4
MIRAPLLVGLLAPLPTLAQDADPSNQLIEGYTACALGEGLADKTVTALGLYGWTSQEDTEMGVVNFQPGVGKDTFAYMSPTPGYCHVESTSLGTARALELLGYLSFSGQVSVDTTETDENGCTTATLSNGVVAVITSGGNDPVCTSETDSGVRFYFGEGQ